MGGEDTGTIELFLTNDTFETLDILATSRSGYAIAATTGHRVVIAGGTHGNSALASIEIYDGDTGKIVSGGAMLTARRNFAAATLLDGSILFTGGYAADGSILATSEIFDPELGTSAAGPALSAARANHKASLLPSNGRVLLIGGVDENGVTASTDVYTSWTGKFSSLPVMHAARQQLVAAPLRRGALVVAGGKGANGALSGSEIFAFATIDTDKPDYSPGEQATFTGTGWTPGEQVLLQVAAFPLDQHRIEFTGSAQADSTGRITIAPFNIDRTHAGMRFLATATGSESQAQNVFTDAAENTVTTIDPIPASSPFNTALAVTGHVQSSGATNPVDSGTVSVSVDGAPPYSTTAVIAASGNFTASSISSIVPGNHTIGAAYSGGGAPPWNASSANAGYQVTTPTTTILNSPLAASAPFGTAVLFQATVASTLGAPAPGTGSIEFHDTNGGNVLITTVPVVAGVAQVTLSNLPAKTYGVQAVYVPAGNGYSTSSSATTTYTVARISPSITTAALPASQTVGDLVTLTSCVTTVAGITPTGTITFNDGAAISGLVSLSAGCASFQYAKLTGGSNTITVVYSGDSNYKFNAIGVGNLVLSVARAVSFSAANSSPATPVPFGTPVQLLGTVTSPATAANGFLIGGASNGTFQDNGVDIPGCALLTVASGSIACNAPPLTVGTHPITFTFLNNDPNFLPSTSPVYNLVVTRYATSGALITIPASPVLYGTAATARVQFGPAAASGRDRQRQLLRRCESPGQFARRLRRKHRLRLAEFRHPERGISQSHGPLRRRYQLLRLDRAVPRHYSGGQQSDAKRKRDLHARFAGDRRSATHPHRDLYSSHQRHAHRHRQFLRRRNPVEPGRRGDHEWPGFLQSDQCTFEWTAFHHRCLWRRRQFQHLHYGGLRVDRERDDNLHLDTNLERRGQLQLWHHDQLHGRREPPHRRPGIHRHRTVL